MERQLEGVRPLLADAESAGEHLCDVLSDPASRAEIQAKLSAVNRQYNTLQKKLDHRKAEIEGSLRLVLVNVMFKSLNYLFFTMVLQY